MARVENEAARCQAVMQGKSHPQYGKNQEEHQRADICRLYRKGSPKLIFTVIHHKPPKSIIPKYRKHPPPI